MRRVELSAAGRTKHNTGALSRRTGRGEGFVAFALTLCIGILVFILGIDAAWASDSSSAIALDAGTRTLIGAWLIGLLIYVCFLTVTMLRGVDVRRSPMRVMRD